jgi:hypothetical protein
MLYIYKYKMNLLLNFFREIQLFMLKLRCGDEIQVMKLGHRTYKKVNKLRHVARCANEKTESQFQSALWRTGSSQFQNQEHH